MVQPYRYGVEHMRLSIGTPRSSRNADANLTTMLLLLFMVVVCGSNISQHSQASNSALHKKLPPATEKGTPLLNPTNRHLENLSVRACKALILDSSGLQ
jgi:hypothetical protein